MEPPTPTVPAPRTSNVESPPSAGPVPNFDYHLRILTDSYLAFFNERKRIEETYVESLMKLHATAKRIDAHLDNRSELNTTRRAWNEVRDNVEREAQARQAFLSTLSIDVIGPLNSLRDSQERTRKRIKEDLKESSMAYNEYCDVTLPRLKNRYMKKYMEVEEQKKVATATAAAAFNNIQSPTPIHATETVNSPLSNSRSNPSLPARPVVTSPQPLKALDRRPSGAGPPRNRSPSTSAASNAFSDLAHQGKKQLNQLIGGFLDKSATIKDGSGRPDALRTVRAKRETDEADKEYRKGVHWLETLRLRRAKILQSGYKSLEIFLDENAATVKLVLERYTDNMTATSTTQTQLSSHAREAVERISPAKDTAKLVHHLPRSLASAIPEPILYKNGKMGYCKDLIFGISLVDYATTHELHNGAPKIVQSCIHEVDQRGLQAEGIYRVSGRHAVVQTLQHEMEKDEAEFHFTPSSDVYAISSLLKLYLRELPEPVFKFPLQDRIQHTEDRAEHHSSGFALLKAKIRRLPPVHQATLKAILEHLNRVVANRDKNKMNAQNLAIVFGGVIFGEDELPKVGELLNVQTWKDSLMEDMILNARVLFDGGEAVVHEPPFSNPSTAEASPVSHGTPQSQHETPLPATPAGEVAAPYAYGTQHTRVTTVPSSPQLESDFTPRLPLRPPNSIHPSSRANQASPTKDRHAGSAAPRVPERKASQRADEPVSDDSSQDTIPFPTTVTANGPFTPMRTETNPAETSIEVSQTDVHIPDSRVSMDSS